MQIFAVIKSEFVHFCHIFQISCTTDVSISAFSVFLMRCFLLLAVALRILAVRPHPERPPRLCPKLSILLGQPTPRDRRRQWRDSGACLKTLGVFLNFCMSYLTPAADLLQEFRLIKLALLSPCCKSTSAKCINTQHF